MMKSIPLIILILSILRIDSIPCTIVMERGDGIAIAGSNEDFFSPLTMMWYTPASDKYYARVCFGFRMVMNSTQGGMNEHGLFVDGNSLGNQGWRPDPARKNFMGSVLDQLLATCASVEEVKDFFLTYNCPALDVARIPVMDKTGASMIVEWYNGEVVFLESERNYQIATNFNGSEYTDRAKPCWRYNRADSLLGQQLLLSVSSVRDALNQTHVEGPGPKTLYSFICDLKSGDIYLYNFHDFSNARKFNFREEIEKGSSSHYLSTLFPERSPAYQKFIEEGPLELLHRGLNSGRSQATLFYHVIKTNYPEAFDMEIGPELLNKFAASLNIERRTEDAIFFQEKNCNVFPGDPSVHFELGKLYHQSGNPGRAIEEYNKTLEIDPGHKGALEALSKIRILS